VADIHKQMLLQRLSQKLEPNWENIGRKVVHINYLNNVCSNFFLNMLSNLTDVTLKNLADNCLKYAGGE
jgi:hypothetical protein